MTPARSPAVLEALAACPSLGGMAVTIKDAVYDVAPLDPGPHRIAFRLAKRDGRDGGVYDVVLTQDGLTLCDCPHYTMRLAGTSARCKHIVSIISAGLIPDVIPLANPTRRQI